MVKTSNRKQAGYTLIEMVLVLVIISVLAAVAMKNLGQVDDVTKTDETKLEMDRLAYALAGNPSLMSAGKRIDYGYIGDVGSLPGSWDNLTGNPGGYATWDGPYIKDHFTASGTDNEFKLDAWGKAYSAPGGSSFQSTGGVDPITRQICATTADLLYNRVELSVTDLNFVPPGADNFDSVSFILSYPNGTGGTTIRSLNPTANGSASFDSIPIGVHLLQTVFDQTGDTLSQKINIDPGHDYYGEIQYYASIWTVSGGGGGGSSGSEILRPDGPGFLSLLISVNCGSNWQCVSEAVSDDDGSYVRGWNLGFFWVFDLYSVSDHSSGSGTIDSIVTHVYCRRDGGGRRARTEIYTNGQRFSGSEHLTTAGYVDYSTSYVSNPATASNWSWSEIDALQIGVGHRRSAYCTQVWVEVFYTN